MSKATRKSTPSRKSRKPIRATKAWRQPTEPDDKRSIRDLSREWKITLAKLRYDLAVIPETVTPEKETELFDRLGDVAYTRMHAIEDELGQRLPDTVDDCQDILRIVLQKCREQGGDSILVEARDVDMISAVHLGLNKLRPEVRS